MPSPPAVRPAILIIRDGWGHNPNPSHDAFNAIKLANTPVADRLMRDWPTTLIRTCGEDVGLPVGVMGNSEVGHQNIGAGRIVDQELMRITRTIRDGSFFTNPAFLAAFDRARKNNSNLHIMGLVSDGKVHSDLDHLFALIDLAARLKFPGDRLFIHAFTDGRDTGPKTGLGFIQKLDVKLNSAGVGRIASVCGRYYSMDRDHRWTRVARAFAALAGLRSPSPSGRGVRGEGSTTEPARAASANIAIQSYYDRPADASRTGDEFIPPTQIIDPATNQPVAVIRDHDAVIFFNFRGDRPRELVKAFMLDDDAWTKVPNAIPNVGGFDRGPKLNNLFFCAMTGYETGLPVSAIAFHKPPKMPHILGEVISAAGLTQFRCAETEKFPHVTFFFNDYREEPFPLEKRELIPSPKDVPTYDQKPEMSAPRVCDAVVARLAEPGCEPLIIVNFANPDMVGHTGKLDAAIKAVETVDACVGRIVDAALARWQRDGIQGGLIITADHGNAEQMWDPVHNCPHTAHTTYDVPLVIVDPAYRSTKLPSPGTSRLADIAPTTLKIMGLPQPPAMSGTSLI